MTSFFSVLVAVAGLAAGVVFVVVVVVVVVVFAGVCGVCENATPAVSKIADANTIIFFMVMCFVYLDSV